MYRISEEHGDWRVEWTTAVCPYDLTKFEPLENAKYLETGHRRVTVSEVAGAEEDWRMAYTMPMTGCSAWRTWLEDAWVALPWTLVGSLMTAVIYFGWRLLSEA